MSGDRAPRTRCETLEAPLGACRRLQADDGKPEVISSHDG